MGQWANGPMGTASTAAILGSLSCLRALPLSTQGPPCPAADAICWNLKYLMYLVAHSHDGTKLYYLMGYALCRWPRLSPIASGLLIRGIVASGSWHLWYPDLSVGMLGDLTLASWGRRHDLGTLGSTSKDTLRPIRGCSTIFS